MIIHVRCGVHVLVWALLLAVGARAEPTRPGHTPNLAASPPSTLLLAGQTTLAVSVNTTKPTTCRWGLASAPYAALPHAFTRGENTQTHETQVEGLSGNAELSHVFIRCKAFQGEELHLVYRSMPDDAAASWPRKGNLWGSGNFAPPTRTLEYAASHVDLWLGAHWSAEQAATLRKLNPSTLVLTSINACEGPDGLPEELYLHNITRPNSTRGRLESWPGAFRLDVTKPATQRYQAMLMYNLMLYGGVGEAGQPSIGNVTMPNDGMFVDNVFLTQSWAKSDIHNNPFFPDTTGTGKPDDPKEFDAKWRAGIIGELRMFRNLMPNAVMSGHAMSPTDPDIQAIFNAISIGFTTVDMIEGKKSFQTGWQEYLDWMTLPKPQPHITMVESAVRLQLGYGYGFDTQLAPKFQGQPGFIPKETYQFSAHEYRYMRFGLAYTLMRDGYFAHELGDSWHGQVLMRPAY